MEKPVETAEIDGSQFFYRGEVRLVPYEPKTFDIHVGGGRLHIDEEGFTTFEGDNVDDAARAFFEHVVTMNNGHIRKLKNEIAKLYERLDEAKAGAQTNG